MSGTALGTGPKPCTRQTRALHSWHLESNRNNNTEQVSPAPCSSKERSPSHMEVEAPSSQMTPRCVPPPQTSPPAHQRHILHCFLDIDICIPTKHFKLNISKTKSFHTFPSTKPVPASPAFPLTQTKTWESHGIPITVHACVRTQDPIHSQVLLVLTSPKEFPNVTTSSCLHSYHPAQCHHLSPKPLNQASSLEASHYFPLLTTLSDHFYKMIIFRFF